MDDFHAICDRALALPGAESEKILHNAISNGNHACWWDERIFASAAFGLPPSGYQTEKLREQIAKRDRSKDRNMRRLGGAALFQFLDEEEARTVLIGGPTRPRAARTVGDRAQVGDHPRWLVRTSTPLPAARFCGGILPNTQVRGLNQLKPNSSRLANGITLPISQYTSGDDLAQPGAE